MQEKLDQISKRYNLIFVLLFGSRAKNQIQNEESDLDIAILAKNDIHVDLFGKLFTI